MGHQQNAGHRGLMLRRRDLIALLGGAISWPLTSRAQTPKRHRIAFLVTGTPLLGQPYIDSFRQDLRALGYCAEVCPPIHDVEYRGHLIFAEPQQTVPFPHRRSRPSNCHWSVGPKARAHPQTNQGRTNEGGTQQSNGSSNYAPILRVLNLLGCYRPLFGNNRLCSGPAVQLPMGLDWRRPNQTGLGLQLACRAVQLSLGVDRCRSNQTGLGLQLAHRAVQLSLGVDRCRSNQTGLGLQLDPLAVRKLDPKPAFRLAEPRNGRSRYG